MEELLLTLHPVYPFTLVQGTGESGTLGWKLIFRSKVIGASTVQQLLFPIGWGHGKQLCSRKRNPDVFGSCSVDSHSATDADSLCTQHHWLQAAKASRINPPTCVSYGEIRALAINVHVSSHLQHTDTTQRALAAPPIFGRLERTTYELQRNRKLGEWHVLTALNKQSIQASPFLGSKEI